MSSALVWGVLALRYLSSSYDMRILPAKRGGRDSPNYRWEGVLKRSWLEKMCSTIPAVLVLCIDSWRWRSAWVRERHDPLYVGILLIHGTDPLSLILPPRVFNIFQY